MRRKAVTECVTGYIKMGFKLWFDQDFFKVVFHGADRQTVAFFWDKQRTVLFLLWRQGRTAIHSLRRWLEAGSSIKRLNDTHPFGFNVYQSPWILFPSLMFSPSPCPRHYSRHSANGLCWLLLAHHTNCSAWRYITCFLSALFVAYLTIVVWPSVIGAGTFGNR